MADVLEPKNLPLSESVARIVIGLVDPSFLGTAIRRPNMGEKTKYIETHWNNIPGDNFSGLPVFFMVPQADEKPDEDFQLQIPLCTPPNSLSYVRFRDAIRCFIMKDQNLVGGICNMIAFNQAGSSALLINIAASMTTVGENKVGGANYWPNALNPPFNSSTTSGPFSTANVLQKVAPKATAPYKTTWQGFYNSRAAHGKAQGAGIFRGNHYLYMDGSPWSKPGNLRGMAPGGNSTHQYQGIQGYICGTPNDVVPPPGPPGPYSPPDPSNPGQQLGGMWLTQKVLTNGLSNPDQAPVNYDELVYLVAGCIIFCVPPALPANSTMIIPAGGPPFVQFKVKIWRDNKGSEELICISPVGRILPDMQPSDPYFIYPISKPGYYRWEFSIYAASIAGIPSDTYAYSVILSSLGEFMGHHMLPGLITNNTQSTLIDGQVATTTADLASVQDNAAINGIQNNDALYWNSSTVAPEEFTKGNDTNLRTAVILANTVTDNNNTGDLLGKSSNTTLTLPTAVDWISILETPIGEDNLQPIPQAFSAVSGTASPYYTNPYVNIDLLAKNSRELDMTETHYSWHPPGSRQEFTPGPNVRTTRKAQIKILQSLVDATQMSDYKKTFISQVVFDFPLRHGRATVNAIMASPSLALSVPASLLQQAITSSIPYDFRFRFTISAEITTGNPWYFGDVMSSVTTREEWEQAVYIVSQLPASATGPNYLEKIFSYLPPVWKNQLITFLKKDIETRPYRI